MIARGCSNGSKWLQRSVNRPRPGYTQGMIATGRDNTRHDSNRGVPTCDKLWSETNVFFLFPRNSAGYGKAQPCCNAAEGHEVAMVLAQLPGGKLLPFGAAGDGRRVARSATFFAADSKPVGHVIPTGGGQYNRIILFTFAVVERHV